MEHSCSGWFAVVITERVHKQPPSAAWQSPAVSVLPLAGQTETPLLCDLHLIKLSGGQLPEEELEKREGGSFAIM